MIQRVFRRVAAVLTGAVLLVTLVSPTTPHLARALIVSIFAVTLWRPPLGLLVAAGLAPLGAYLGALDNVADHYRLTEVILLSFISAWLLRPASTQDGPRLPRYAWLCAWLFAVLLGSLVFGLCRQLIPYTDALQKNLHTAALHYFSYADPTGIADAARMLEAFAVAGATIELFRRAPSLARSLPTVLGLSAIVAAATSVLLWFGLAPDRILQREAVIGYRFSAHVLDPNAAGSYFVLVLCLALGMAVREKRGGRVFWAFAATACAVGLWMTRSRSAEAAAGLVVPVAFLWAATTQWTRTKRALLLAGVFIALVAFGSVRAVQIEHDPTYIASGFRQQFVMSSFRVIGTHPYLGIGPGRYFRDSPNFLTPQLAWSYGSENAHNNFLEITTEAGIIGFFLYAAWFVGALTSPFHALGHEPRDWRLLGCIAGIIAFLGTCLMGHPLLVQEVATVFFLQTALASSLGRSALMNRLAISPHRDHRDDLRQETNPWRSAIAWKTITAVGTIAFAVLPAWTLEKPLMPVHLEEVDGMYYADGGIADGVPFRWARRYASVYVPARARVIELPLRSPIAAITKEPSTVEVSVNGTTIANVLVGTTWTYVTVTLPVPDPPLQFSRINLRANHTARVADVTPATDDQREIALQIGDIQMVRASWEYVPQADAAHEEP